jgi:hypothetical protein
MAQPVDYCEGNFDNDSDQDGTDAFVFKSDFGRSSLLDPCPVIACETAEQLEMRIAQLEALLANVTRIIVEGQETIRFSNMNVQIVSGSGNTSGTVNGRGNLIVGYNETRNDGADDRTGSHNIVVGSRHNYASYGGLVAGRWNTVSGPYASVSGGTNNTASSQASSVSGGANNMSSSQSSSVSGGRYNVASGDYSFVGGGGGDTADYGNKAFGHYSAILGGTVNIAGDPDLTDHTIGQNACVSGGNANTASGDRSSVSGGASNTASGNNASVSGGHSNESSGQWASVSGGLSNTASAWYASVSGGSENTASGGSTSVSGGSGNEATNSFASVSGGFYNTASGDSASVSGGNLNLASGTSANVSGGFANTASGGTSSVSGGMSHNATGEDDWRAGSLFQDL